MSLADKLKWVKGSMVKYGDGTSTSFTKGLTRKQMRDFIAQCRRSAPGSLTCGDYINLCYAHAVLGRKTEAVNALKRVKHYPQGRLICACEPNDDSRREEIGRVYNVNHLAITGPPLRKRLRRLRVRKKGVKNRRRP